MSNYTVKTGDTFSSIARIVYGDDNRANEVRQANPGTSEPLQAGVVLITPTRLPNASVKITEDDNEVSISIEGVLFKKWTSLTITRSVDSFDTLELAAPMEPDNKSFRDTFKPFTFKNIQATVGNNLLFTGTLVDVNPSFFDNIAEVLVGAYSLPGVLSDCTYPASKFPLEFENQNLRSIAASLVEPFGLKAVFNDNVGATFDRVAVEPDRGAFDFLADLARQRGLIISNNENGDILFRKITVSSPVANLIEGETGLLSVSSSFGPQQYFSHITGLQPSTVGIGGSQYTVKNTKLNTVLRPHSFQINDATDGDAELATKAKMGRMFGDSVKYEVRVPSWRDASGALWLTGSTVKVFAPKAMIYSETLMIVKQIKFFKDAFTELSTLELVLPGSYSGEIPGVLPWDE